MTNEQQTAIARKTMEESMADETADLRMAIVRQAAADYTRAPENNSTIRIPQERGNRNGTQI